MAIIKNREKESPSITTFVVALPDFCRRGALLFATLLSLALLYNLPEAPQQRFALEISGSLNSAISSSIRAITNEIRKIFSYFEYLENLRAENITLKLEIARLSSIQQRASILENENKSLKDALNFVNKLDYRYMTAPIVSVATDIYSQSAIVQAGTNQGLHKDQLVMSDKGLVGRIVDLSNNYSKVMLVTDFDSRIPVISSHSRLQTVIAGTGNKLARALYLPEHSGVQVGETLLTSGDGKNYPAGLPVAKVSRIENGEVYATPLVDLSKLDFVTILFQEEK
jgi:rod shape-determining protein MreC